jgi:predicted MPP superfamily phosphohydrolase
MHRPANVVHAAALGARLALAGHSHGGQVRTPWGQCFHNSSDLPLDTTSGLMRHRDTLLAVSRGVGRSAYTPRLFCPPHLPIYTLRPGRLPDTPRDRVTCFRPW